MRGALTVGRTEGERWETALTVAKVAGELGAVVRRRSRHEAIGQWRELDAERSCDVTGAVSSRGRATPNLPRTRFIQWHLRTWSPLAHPIPVLMDQSENKRYEKKND
jgi:hypothetical protein